MKKIALCLLVACSSVLAQATFEPPTATCALATYPAPCGTPGGAEGISANNLAMSTADTANGCGFPTQGLQYGRVVGSGPVAVPSGGPYGGVGGNQIYIPVPPGAGAVSFSWDFYNAEGGSSATFNDGMSVDVVGACGGPSLLNLAYADTFSAAGPCIDGGGACSSFAFETMPAGPNPAAAALPVGSLYIQVTVWNGGDNAVSGHAVLDCVNFDVASVPCITACALFFSSPGGPGSLQIDNTACPPSAGLDYQIGVTLAAGAFPAGWFFGLDITLTDLIGQHGPAFFGILWGTLDGAGASTFGPVGGLPSGLTVYAVTSEWAPGFGLSLGARPPVAYVIP